MRIALSQLEYEIKGKGTKATFHPLYLSKIDENKVKAIIQFLDKNTGKKQNEIDFTPLWTVFPSERVSKALVSAAKRFYNFESRNIKSLLQEEIPEIDQDKKESFDMGDFLQEKIQNQHSLSFMGAETIREKIFDYINTKHHGFVATKKRNKVLLELAKELEIPEDKVDQILYMDIESEKELKLMKKGGSKELIRYFNYDVIETTLCYALSIRFTVDKLPGYLAKNMVYISKQNYVWSEIQKEGEGFIITIEPPFEAFQEKKTWGRNLAEVGMYILRTVLRDGISFEVQTIIQPRKQKALFTLNTQSLPLLPNFDREGEEINKTEVDSKIEQNFLDLWRNNRGWKATVEPETVLLGKKMFVPDFVLERGKKRIYLEIVGYYTDKYIQKKKAKMEEIAKIDFPIIYLIDKQLENHFVSMHDLNIVYYSKNIVPNNDILKILQTTFSDFEERSDRFIETMIILIDEITEKGLALTFEQLRKQLGSYSQNELEKILSLDKIEQYIEEANIEKIEGFGLIAESKIQKVRNKLAGKGTIPLEELKNQFTDIKEGLIAICQHLGCKIKWKSINEIEIAIPF